MRIITIQSSSLRIKSSLNPELHGVINCACWCDWSGAWCCFLFCTVPLLQNIPHDIALAEPDTGSYISALWYSGLKWLMHELYLTLTKSHGCTIIQPMKGYAEYTKLPVETLFLSSWYSLRFMSLLSLLCMTWAELRSDLRAPVWKLVFQETNLCN